MVTPLLELREVSFAYAEGHWSLRRVSMVVRPGERVALLGPNGAGKSTLLLIMNGSEKPCAGSVWLDGYQLTGSRDQAPLVRRSIGLLLQDPDDQLIAPTVEQDVAIGPALMGAGRIQIRRIVEEALALMNIEHLAHRAVHELSLGEKKRAALAGIVALRPRLLLLDEPTAGLDPAGVKALARILDALQEEGTAIVQTTHDVNLAYEWADSAFIMEGGTVLGGGEAGEVLANESLLDRAGLDLPLRLQPAVSTRRRLR